MEILETNNMNNSDGKDKNNETPKPTPQIPPQPKDPEIRIMPDIKAVDDLNTIIFKGTDHTRPLDESN